MNCYDKLNFKKEQDRIRVINPCFRLQKILNEGNLSGAATYRIASEKDSYVLKVAFPENSDAQEKVYREAIALHRAKSIAGIPTLVKFYNNRKGYRAILKNYFAGNDLEQLQKPLTETRLQNQLYQTIKSFHVLGISHLDIFPRNIVLSPDEQDIAIVDLDSCIFERELAFDEFNDLKKMDIENFVQLFEFYS